MTPFTEAETVRLPRWADRDTMPLPRVEAPESPVAPPVTWQPSAGPRPRSHRRTSRVVPPRVTTGMLLRGALRRAWRAVGVTVLETLQLIISAAIGTALGLLVVIGVMSWIFS